MNKRVILMALSLTAIVGLSACNKLDVVGDTSIKSFDKVLSIDADRVRADDANGGFSIVSPDGEAKFIWSKDFGKTSPYDVQLVVNVKPFLDAGLDVSKLPEGTVVDEKIIVGKDLGNESLTYSSDITPLESYKQIVKLYRNSIKYHIALDHFGIDLANGNMFEWAKDMSTNEKDMVFVLGPQVLIDAGVDPAKVQGWVYAKVPTMDAKGMKIEVYKFLKPFNLDGQPK